MDEECVVERVPYVTETIDTIHNQSKHTVRMVSFRHRLTSSALDPAQHKQSLSVPIYKRIILPHTSLVHATIIIDFYTNFIYYIMSMFMLMRLRKKKRRSEQTATQQ